VIIARMRENGWPVRWHPQDMIPWVHYDDLAEMTFLAATQRRLGTPLSLWPRTRWSLTSMAG